jgi:hypothetical protein
MPKQELDLPFAKEQPLSLEQMRLLLPEGFTRRERNNGIWEKITAEHGPGHALFIMGLIHRYAPIVAARTGNILNMTGLDGVAIFHDAKRVNDGNDPNHARRAAAPLRKYLQSKNFSKEQAELLVFVCKHHCVPIGEINHKEHDKRATRLLGENHFTHLRFFMFCDVLSQVRYAQNGHRVTNQMLEEILPRVFQKDELSSIIAYAEMWYQAYEKTMKVNNLNPRLAGDQIRAMLETGLHPMVFAFKK